MSHAGLFVNGVIKARQASNNNGGTNQFITAGSSMALLLNEGDEVYIMDVYGYTVNLGSQWTAFGGVLINWHKEYLMSVKFKKNKEKSI